MSEPTTRREQQTNKETKGADPRLTLTHHQIEAAARALSQIDWGEDGLTRDQIREHYPALPRSIYLHLPSSKHFSSTAEVLQQAELAASRAEGEFMGANPDLPEEESIADGGPPAWGPTPLFTPGGVVDGGSAEDTEERDEGE